VRLFLDTSVLLAASGSERGASREIFRLAPDNGWILLATPYVVEELLTNLPKLPATATADWARLRPNLVMMDDVLTLDQAVVFEPAKDRPILFGALAWAEVLLTLDRADFGGLLGDTFYGLAILTPGMFLERERAAGRLRE
jgi:predicted nucleic acid-binding protein